MNRQRPQPGSRREFLSTLAGAATAGLVGLPLEPAGAEPPPETTRLATGAHHRSLPRDASVGGGGPAADRGFQ